MVKKSTLLKKLSSYSTLATIVIAGADKAEGQIIYHDIKPDTVLHTSSVYVLDLNGDLVPDFEIVLGKSVATSSGVVNGAGILGLAKGDSIEKNTVNSFSTFAKPNGYNNVIGASDKWLTTAGFDYCQVKSFKNHGVFGGKGDKYAGLKITKAGKVYYGWVRVNLNSKCDSLIIKDYAYNSVAGVSIKAGQGTTGIDAVNSDAATLESFNPNPATNTTTVIYNMNVAGVVTLELYDIMGRQIETLVNNTDQSPGRYKIPADVSHLSNGVYLYALTVNGQTFTQKLVVTR